jgi:hypothetical protein
MVKVRALFEERSTYLALAAESEGYGELTPYLLPSEGGPVGPTLAEREQAILASAEATSRAEFAALCETYPNEAAALTEVFEVWSVSSSRTWQRRE